MTDRGTTIVHQPITIPSYRTHHRHNYYKTKKQQQQDIPTIWWANAVATGAAYGYAFTFASRVEEEDDDDANVPAPLKAAFKVGGQRGICGRLVWLSWLAGEGAAWATHIELLMHQCTYARSHMISNRRWTSARAGSAVRGGV